MHCLTGALSCGRLRPSAPTLVGPLPVEFSAHVRTEPSRTRVTCASSAPHAARAKASMVRRRRPSTYGKRAARRSLSPACPNVSSQSHGRMPRDRRHRVHPDAARLTLACRRARHVVVGWATRLTIHRDRVLDAVRPPSGRAGLAVRSCIRIEGCTHRTRTHREYFSTRGTSAGSRAGRGCGSGRASAGCAPSAA